MADPIKQAFEEEDDEDFILMATQAENAYLGLGANALVNNNEGEGESLKKDFATLQTKLDFMALENAKLKRRNKELECVLEKDSIERNSKARVLPLPATPVSKRGFPSSFGRFSPPTVKKPKISPSAESNPPSASRSSAPSRILVSRRSASAVPPAERCFFSASNDKSLGMLKNEEQCQAYFEIEKALDGWPISESSMNVMASWIESLIPASVAPAEKTAMELDLLASLLSVDRIRSSYGQDRLVASLVDCLQKLMESEVSIQNQKKKAPSDYQYMKLEKQGSLTIRVIHLLLQATSVATRPSLPLSKETHSLLEPLIRRLLHCRDRHLFLLSSSILLNVVKSIACDAGTCLHLDLGQVGEWLVSGSCVLQPYDNLLLCLRLSKVFLHSASVPSRVCPNLSGSVECFFRATCKLVVSNDKLSEGSTRTKFSALLQDARLLLEILPGLSSPLSTRSTPLSTRSTYPMYRVLQFYEHLLPGPTVFPLPIPSVQSEEKLETLFDLNHWLLESGKTIPGPAFAEGTEQPRSCVSNTPYLIEDADPGSSPEF